MTVQDLIDELNKFDKDLIVTVTDGHRGLCYKGDYELIRFGDFEGNDYVDIGIGGTQE